MIKNYVQISIEKCDPPINKLHGFLEIKRVDMLILYIENIFMKNFL